MVRAFQIGCNCVFGSFFYIHAIEYIQEVLYALNPNAQSQFRQKDIALTVGAAIAE